MIKAVVNPSGVMEVQKERSLKRHYFCAEIANGQYGDDNRNRPDDVTDKSATAWRDRQPNSISTLKEKINNGKPVCDIRG